MNRCLSVPFHGFIFQLRGFANLLAAANSRVFRFCSYFPSFGRGFDSHRPLTDVTHVSGRSRLYTDKLLKTGPKNGLFWTEDGPKCFQLDRTPVGVYVPRCCFD